LESEENLIINISLYLSLPDLLSICLSCQKWNQLIGQLDYFWKLKLIRDFGMVEECSISWKKMYQQYINDIWICGLNNFGQLGLGDRFNRNVPTKIPGLKATHIAGGYYHTVVID